MAMTTVKSEDKLGKFHLGVIDEAPETKRVKRRQRDASAATAEQQEPNQEAGPICAPTTVKRSSKFRGVSRHKWTGRYEAHLWDKLLWNPNQKKKGKQVYLGAYDDEEAAARAYDLAALKYWGTSTLTNYPISDYETETKIMQTMKKEEYLASLRRSSSSFSRGVSKYRGVARHHHNGRWEARIGRVFGNKYLYLGTYNTQEEAARAYDIAAIEYRGINAVTNFELRNYIRWLKPEAVPAQETKAGINLTSWSSHFPAREEFVSPCLKRSFSANDLRETFSSKLPIGPSSKSSPTALGLLLRSSLFRELLEKNSNVSEQIHGANTKKHTHEVAGDNENERILYSGARPQFCNLEMAST